MLPIPMVAMRNRSFLLCSRRFALLLAVNFFFAPSPEPAGNSAKHCGKLPVIEVEVASNRCCSW